LRNELPVCRAVAFGEGGILANLQKLFFAKVGISRFLLGNRENLAVVANATFSRQGDKMAG
jgi:hypothetical protein